MTETDDIIEHLAEDLKPVPRNALRRRFTLGIVPAMGFSLLLMLIILGLRIDMPDVLMLPVFWIKSAYNALVAVAAFIAVYRLSRPDGSEGGFFGLLALIFAAMAVVAAIQLLMAPVGTYRLLILGSSALHCPLLIVGFALHNTTEGFGIVGPLAAANVRASWGWLGLAGLIGGGPTFLGTIVATSFSSSYLFVGCLALAAGALLYVIGEILPVGRRLSWEVTLWGLMAGFFLGLATELVLEVAGG